MRFQPAQLGDCSGGADKDFLERLGRAVEVVRKDRLIARHRTALIEEETEFKLLETNSARPVSKRGTINIVASGVPLPDRRKYPNAFYFEDFLDRTVQADRISNDVLADRRIQAQVEQFIPQYVSAQGRHLDFSSFQYVLRDWMPDDHRRLLAVLAPAGYGKTALTCALTARMARDYLTSGDDWRPMSPYLIDFGAFRRLASFEAMILTSLQNKGITDYHSNAFSYLVKRQRVILILDGFDELLEERPEEAQKNLRELIETLEGRGKVIVTARSTFFRTSDDVADFLAYYLNSDQVSVVDLQPFDRRQRRELVAKLAPTQRDINRINGFIESEALDEPMGSPLLLKETIDALLTDKDARLDRTRGRQNLFAALEKSVYERERQRQSHLFADTVQAAFLKALAREMLQFNARGFDWEEVQVAAMEAAGDGAEPTELDRLADHHFLHVSHDSSEVRFNHQVFREYFQALALLHACEAGQDDWILAMLSQRPLPEEVRSFVAEIDKKRRFSARLLTLIELTSRPSERLASNIGSVCASYGDPALIGQLLGLLPNDVALGFRITKVDLSGLDWSERILYGMEFSECSLHEASFAQSMISELSLHGTSITGTKFTGATIDSLTLDYGQRVLGTADVLERLTELGADCGLESEEQRRDLRSDHRTRLIELARGRLRRFYLPGAAGPEGSRWDSNIQGRTCSAASNQRS